MRLAQNCAGRTYTGPRYARFGGGSVQTGRFAGKMIVVQALMDEAAYPWQADWYRSLVQSVLGPGLEPFLLGSAVLLTYWVMLYWMYRRKLFLKI